MSFAQKTWFVVLGVIVAAVLLLKIFPGDWILPQTIPLLGFSFRIYGLILGLAVLAGYWFARKRIAQTGLGINSLDNIAVVLLVSGFIGARLYHVVTSWDYYSNNLNQIFAVWNGGLGILGAVVGSLAGLWIYNHYFLKANLGKLVDWLVPSLVLGSIIGRFGNLFNYEVYGQPTNLPWGMFVPEQFRLAGFELIQFFHPLFLYEVLGGLLILYILLNFALLSKKLNLQRFHGDVFWVWLFLFSLLRIFIESMRIETFYFAGLSQSLMALLLAALALGVIIYQKFLGEHESKST